MSTATIWTHGRIFTGRRYVEAVAAENGRVVAAGGRRAVRSATATGAQRIDLGGRLAVPGLADAHLHLTETCRFRAGVDLRGASSLAVLGRRVREWADRHPRGPVYGGGWDQDRLREGRYPNAMDLGRWVGDRQAVLFRVCHHAALASDSVLAEIGVDAATPDPPGGRIGRGSDGAPDGLLFDNALAGLGEWGDRMFARHPLGLDGLLRTAAGYGLTTIGPVSAAPPEVETVAAAARRRRLPVRIVSFLRAGDRSKFRVLRRRTRTPSTRLVGLKVVSDGAFGPRTAWLDRPYRDRPDEAGFPLVSRADLELVATEAESMGATLALHAIGDRAIAGALDVIEAVRPARRPRLEHASLTPPALLRRLDRVRPHLVVQPGFVPSDSWMADRLGPRRARWTYAFATLHARGHAPAAPNRAGRDPSSTSSSNPSRWRTLRDPERGKPPGHPLDRPGRSKVRVDTGVGHVPEPGTGGARGDGENVPAVGGRRDVGGTVSTPARRGGRGTRNPTSRRGPASECRSPTAGLSPAAPHRPTANRGPSNLSPGRDGPTQLGPPALEFDPPVPGGADGWRRFPDVSGLERFLSGYPACGAWPAGQPLG